MEKSYRWGLIGTGFIAGQFIEGLSSIERAEVTAVASISQEEADRFGAVHGIPNRYGNVEDFLKDDTVDIVYIATPHPLHYSLSLQCMEAKKAVLCEKPAAINQVQLKAMIDCAEKNQVFFMEALFTRFLPATLKLQELIAADVIGEVKRVTADFAFNVAPKKGRLYEPELGGGALLDVGVYVLGFASMLLGYEPSQVIGQAYIGETGVDERSSILLAYEGGRSANLFCAVSLAASEDAVIYGEKGCIYVPDFWHPSRFVVKQFDSDEQQEVYLPFESVGYNYEAEEVMHCLDAGERESGRMQHAHSLKMMGMMDALRRQWGLKYPME